VPKLSALDAVTELLQTEIGARPRRSAPPST
jgi:hypothetical protein